MYSFNKRKRGEVTTLPSDGEACSSHQNKRFKNDSGMKNGDGDSGIKNGFMSKVTGGVMRALGMGPSLKDQLERKVKGLKESIGIEKLHWPKR